jgi:type II secretory ATPase GspE/PulE/Tfp pilus assembly ATPase PilB-like protein
VLAQLGLGDRKIEALFRPYQPPPEGEGKKKKKGEEEICPDCNGLGYKGRTALFELLIVDDPVRQTLVKEPSADALKAASRKARVRSFQDEGIQMVVDGVTALEEVIRVLKQ